MKKRVVIISILLLMLVNARLNSPLVVGEQLASQIAIDADALAIHIAAQDYEPEIVIDYTDEQCDCDDEIVSWSDTAKELIEVVEIVDEKPSNDQELLDFPAIEVTEYSDPQREESVSNDQAFEAVALELDGGGQEQSNREEKIMTPVVSDTVAIEFTDSPTKEPDVLTLQNKFDTTLKELSLRADFGENGLRSLMNLVDLDVILVNHLLAGSKGYHVEKVIRKKQVLRTKSNSSVLQLHDTILYLATYTTPIEKKLNEYVEKHENRLWCALAWNDKQDFLDHMKSTLTHYYTLLQDMHYALVALPAGE